MKIVTVVGARPQFIKAAAVSRAIAAHNAESIAKSERIDEVIVHTGQHFDRNMSNIFFEEMEIPQPNYRLDINSLSHGAMTGRMLEAVEGVLLEENPDFVVVYGDTNSTLAGALAAKKLNIKVVHIEARLRSFNMNMPEEINRILTDRINDILCCPTEAAMSNLKSEGFDRFDCTCVQTGDVMLDAALYYSTISASKSEIIQDLGLDSEPFALCTVHRAENTDDPERISSIVRALNEIAEKIKVVMPLHPRTRRLLGEQREKLKFEPIDPVSYFDMLELLQRTKVVLTDSGGLQKEAYFFKKPCITLRDETEWVELVTGGYNRLAGAERHSIVDAFSQSVDRGIPTETELCGAGQSSGAIIQTLCNET